MAAWGTEFLRLKTEIKNRVDDYDVIFWVNDDSNVSYLVNNTELIAGDDLIIQNSRVSNSEKFTVQNLFELVTRKNVTSKLFRENLHY